MLAVAAQAVRAQYDASFSHYWALESVFNPAAVGKEPKLNIAAAYAKSMAGFENSPATMYAGADIPLYFLRTYHGVGLQFMNDEIGLFSHKRFALQYALKFKLFGGMISAGVNVGLLSEGFDGGSVDTETPDDPAFPSSDATGTGVDIGVGLYYSHRNWYVGLSALHLNSPSMDIGDAQTFNVDATYYLT